MQRTATVINGRNKRTEYGINDGKDGGPKTSRQIAENVNPQCAPPRSAVRGFLASKAKSGNSERNNK